MSENDEQSLRDAIGLPRNRRRRARGAVLPRRVDVGTLVAFFENFPPEARVFVRFGHLPMLRPVRLETHTDGSVVVVCGAYFAEEEDQ